MILPRKSTYVRALQLQNCLNFQRVENNCKVENNSWFPGGKCLEEQEVVNWVRYCSSVKY